MPPVIPVLALALLVCFCLARGISAQETGENSLSAEEARFADCAGEAMALESLWRTEVGDDPNAVSEAEAYAERTDRMLHVATMRHVGAGHLVAFRARAAATLAATRARFAVMVSMIPDPAGLLRQMANSHAATCDPLFPP